MDLNHTAREIFAEALRGLDIPAAMRTHVKRTAHTIAIGTESYSIPSFPRILLIAIGKAAVPMADALLLQLQPAITADQSIAGIVVGSSIPRTSDPRLRFFEGAHPLPDHTSQAAALAILQLLHTATPDCLVFFLISGGASAMVEHPLDPTLSIDDAGDLYRALIHSGLPIARMNVLRKHFSRVKGGRLATAAHKATHCTLLISDVRRDEEHVIGSGPTLPDPSTVADCRHILASTPSLRLSPPLRKFFEDPTLEETPKPNHPAFHRSQSVALLSSDHLTELAAQAAMARGYEVILDHTCDEWDYRDAAKYLLHRLEQLRPHHPRLCLLSAGELSVHIPGSHGTGGRNQQFVLESARLLTASLLDATILSAGSDGIDGNSTAAGALCNQTTAARAAALDLDIAAALDHFDTNPIFTALGDAILTTPTGNNVRDLRILLTSA